MASPSRRNVISSQLMPDEAGGGVGGAVAYWLGVGFWPTLAIALVCGFAPIIGYRLWKRLHHRR